MTIYAKLIFIALACLSGASVVAAVTQAQIAATVAELVGEDFRAFNRSAAPSLLEAMRKR